MFVKLAARNVRRSAGDWLVYALTLAAGAVLIYSFNSLDHHGALFASGDDVAYPLASATDTIRFASVFVALVFGFLALYANRFLISQRRREFGTYLALGMSLPRLAVLIWLEAGFVTLVACASGLLIGIGASQLLAYVTALLLDTRVAAFHFFFSPYAAGITLACFAAIFLLTFASNLLAVSRLTVSNLLRPVPPSRQGRLSLSHVARTSMIAIISGLCLLLTLYFLGFSGDSWELELAFLVFIALTWGVFRVLPPLIHGIGSRIPTVYLRHLRMFTARQLSGRVRTARPILVMLTATISASMVVLSIGLGSALYARSTLASMTRFDASIMAFPYVLDEEVEMYEEELPTLEEDFPGEEGESARADVESSLAEARSVIEGLYADNLSMATALAQDIPQWNSIVAQSAQIDCYASDTLLSDMVMGTGDGPSTLRNPASMRRLPSGRLYHNALVVPLSQFNALMLLLGEETITLEEGTYAINNTAPSTAGIAHALTPGRHRLSIGGEAAVYSGTLRHVELSVSSYQPQEVLTVIAPDSLLDSVRAARVLPETSTLNVMYASAREGDEQLYETFAQAYPLYSTEDAGTIAGETGHEFAFAESTWPASMVVTASQARNLTHASILEQAYAVIYLGLVLLLAAAAVLAVLMLAETSQSFERYRTLGLLGCDRSMTDGSLRWQNAMFFLVPLALAAVFSFFAISRANSFFIFEVGEGAMGFIYGTAGALTAVYIAYIALAFVAEREVLKVAARRSRYLL